MKKLNKVKQTDENYYNLDHSDKNSELFWHVDKDDNSLGSVTRGECHNPNNMIWHRTTHAYLFNKKGDLILTKRGQNKDTAPGLWTASAAGHVMYGDTYEDTIKREVKEELGVSVDPQKIDKLAVNFGFEKEVIGIFSGKISDKVKPNRAEVDEILEIPLDEFINGFKSGKYDLSGGSRESIKHIIETGSLKDYWEKTFKN